MPAPHAHLVLREAANDELIVTADFAATGRTAATFHDLAAMLRVDSNIWEIAPLRYGTEAGVTGADQVARWIDDIRDSGLHVSSVVGFCGGSVYAAELAEQISTWQDDPALVLLDPGIPVPTMLTEHVEGWVRRVAGSLEAEQVAAIGGAVAGCAEAAATDLELADLLGELFATQIAPALQAVGHSALAAQRFAGLVNGYLHWLGGAMSLDPRARWRTAPALNSNSPGFGLFLVPAEERAGLVGPTTWFDVVHFELMRTPAVAALVDSLLDRAAAPVA